MTYKDEGKTEDLVQFGASAPPEIPCFDGKDSKRKGRKDKGGAVLVGGGSAGGAGSAAGPLASGAAQPAIATISVRGLSTASPTLITRILQNFSLHHGLSLLTIALTAAAVYSLYSMMDNSGGKREAERAARFPAATTHDTFRSSSRETEGPATPGSLSYLMAANQAFTLRDAPGVDVRMTPPGGAADPVLPPVLQDANLPTSAKRLPEAGAGQAKPLLVSSKGWGENKGVANATTLASGAMYGGAGQLPGGMNAPEGMSKSFRSQKSPYKARRDMKSVYTNTGVGSALEQLFRSNSMSRRALGRTSSEGRSFEAAQAFGSGPYGSVAPVRPSGLGQTEDKAPSASDPGDGGPIAGTTAAESDPAPPPGEGEDKSPWTPDVIAAEALLTTASGIITTIGALAVYKGLPVIGQILQGYMTVLYVAATGMAAAATALGVEIMTKHWQREQGIILTVGGAITTACGALSLLAPQAVSPWVSVLGGIAGIGAAIGGLLAGMMNKDKGDDKDKKKKK